MTNLCEMLIDQLMMWARETGRTPTDISLPRHAFLNIAADAQGGRIYEKEFDGLPIRIAVRPEFRGFADPFSAHLNINKDLTREVRVGDSFVIQGPCGPITVREAKEQQK
jgi:hypothetical protein